MASRWQWKPIGLVATGIIVMLIGSFVGAKPGNGTIASLLCGGTLALSSALLMRRDQSTGEKELEQQREAFAATQKQFETERNEFDQQRAGIEDWRDGVQTALDKQITRIESRERDLAEKFAVHQELFEYPSPIDNSATSTDEHLKLSEQDRKVLDIIQKEAERVYEKIRDNGYTTNEKVDVTIIRDDVLELINRVAKVYFPESDNPLLETSFEQLARAVGRICMHSLVILEQLPLDVKQYNINNLYGYIRKAVKSYGVYQSASPWLTYLSRGAYAGRFLAGGNPVTLGAWWLATEVGKRAGAKIVSNVIDQQAIGLLHDLIRIVGFEVANVYGGDFRHRDAAWAYGSELTDLVQRFPQSRESLREGLRQVSSLPLRSEYDRIYLYRCLADHRAAGLQLADSALLSRAEREQIAQGVEKFFAEFVHGANDADVSTWRDDFEQRFEMKLKLDGSEKSTVSASQKQACIRSVFAFLTGVIGQDKEAALEQLAKSKVLLELDAQDRTDLVASLRADESPSFEPPDIDPASELVPAFLDDLTRTAINSINNEPHVEQLIVETGSYFRASTEETRQSINAAYVARVAGTFDDDAPAVRLSAEVARAALAAKQDGELVAFAFPGVSIDEGTDGKPRELAQGWLIGLRVPAGGTRLVLTQIGEAASIVWTASTAAVSRDKGFLIDDCHITGGDWAVGQTGGSIVVAGTMRGGGYKNYFKPLLKFGGVDEA